MYRICPPQLLHDVRDIAHQMTTHGRHLERLEKQFSERIDALSSSQRTLEQALHPAVQFVVQTLAPRFPRGLPLWRRWEMVYVVLNILFERYYLKRYGATFTEHFYSLQREVVRATPLSSIELAELKRRHGTTKLPLPRRTRYMVLMLHVIYPFILTKMDAHYQTTLTKARTGEQPLTLFQEIMLRYYG